MEIWDIKINKTENINILNIKLNNENKDIIKDLTGIIKINIKIYL